VVFAAALPWSMPLLATALLVSLGAGFVRGFAGFGYSALAVSGLSMLVSPAAVVPAVLSLEVIASAGLLRSSLTQIDRAWLRALLMGNLVLAPVGIASLVLLPDDLLRLLLGGTLLLCSGCLRLAGSHTLRDTVALRAAAGMGSGLLNGLASSGGVWAAMLMAGSGMPAAALRATMNVFLLIGGAYALLWAAAFSAGQGGAKLLSPATLLWIGLLLPTMWLGIWWGRHCFANTRPDHFRHQVLNLLIVISSLGVLRALWGLQNT
jgi:uncharacterized protein